MALKDGATVTSPNFQNISWNTPPNVLGHANKTIVAWIYYATDAMIYNGLLNGSSNYEAWMWEVRTSGKIRFHNMFTGAPPNFSYWDTNSSISAGVHQLAFTYNNSSAANDPIIYIDGVSAALTVQYRNTGTSATGTGNPFWASAQSSFLVGNTTNTLYNSLIYNRIFTPSEILESYNSKLAVPSWRGLVFAPQLWTVKDGQALGASDVVRDLISGAAGTPTGSPIGRGDNVLRIEGIN